jgi:hypothetical protein
MSSDLSRLPTNQAVGSLIINREAINDEVAKPRSPKGRNRPKPFLIINREAINDGVAKPRSPKGRNRPKPVLINTLQ